MTYYCSECAVWNDTKYEAKYLPHNGRDVIHRWCSYDGKYRACDQIVSPTSCRGFVYVRRAVLTKLCEILNVNPIELFNSFDDVKDNYVITVNPELLACYSSVSEDIVNGLDNLPNKEEVAKALFNSYVVDAEASVKMGDYCKAVNIYSEMVKILHIIFEVINERSLFHDLTKIK